AEDGIRDFHVTGVQTCALPISIAKDNIDTLNTFGRIVPIVLGILGVIALIAGILLGIRGGSTPAPASAGGYGPRGGSGSSARPEIGRASRRAGVESAVLDGPAA